MKEGNGRNLPESRKTTASHFFVSILSIISIIGFLGIISSTLFSFDLSFYIEAAFMIIIGLGFVFEGEIMKLKRIKFEGLTPRNFAKLITVLIGLLSLVTGIFSIPQLRIESPGFLAVKGIVAIIAIVVIVIQTWIVE